jgi:hypothetical protein
MIQTSTESCRTLGVSDPDLNPYPSMNYVLFCQPVLARKEVETIANGGDKGGVAGRVLAYKVSYGRF